MRSQVLNKKSLAVTSFCGHSRRTVGSSAQERLSARRHCGSDDGPSLFSMATLSDLLPEFLPDDWPDQIELKAKPVGRDGPLAPGECAAQARAPGRRDRSGASLQHVADFHQQPLLFGRLGRHGGRRGRLLLEGVHELDDHEDAERHNSEINHRVNE